MRYLILIATLAACGDDGVPDVDVDNPDEIVTCEPGAPAVMCERACFDPPKGGEQTGAACDGATASTPGNDNDTRSCNRTFRVNGDAGCCAAATDAIGRFYRCP